MADRLLQFAAKALTVLSFALTAATLLSVRHDHSGPIPHINGHMGLAVLTVLTILLTLWVREKNRLAHRHRIPRPPRRRTRH